MRAASRFIATSFLIVPACVLVGCDTDTHKADKQIRADMQQAAAQREVHGEATDLAAKKILDTLAKQIGGSPATRAQLAAMRAQVQVDAALELLRQIDRKELDLASVSFHLDQLAVQLDAGSVMAVGYGKYDPKAARDHIAEQLAAAQGSNDKPTWEYQSIAMPTLAAVKQKISELEGDLAKLEEQAKSLTDQRDGLMKQSETASQAADASKGEESIAHYKEYSNLRKQAGDLFTQAEAITARTIPVKSDLAIQHGQLDVLNDIVKALTAQQEALDAGWKAINQQIEMQNAQAKQIAGSASASSAAPTTNPLKEGPTIADKAARIIALAGEIRSIRQEAQSDLDDAAKLFADAYRSADQSRRDRTIAMADVNNDPKRADVMASKIINDVLDPQAYRLREAATRRLIGSLYASDAASLTSRINLEASVGPIIEHAGAAIPADLRPGTLSKDADTATKLAEEAYQEADKLLVEIGNGTSAPSTKNAALVERILTLYGQSQVAKLSGSSKSAQEFLQQAMTQRGEAIEQGIKLPAMPAELTPAPKIVPPPPAPATVPTTEPATEPSASPESSDAPATQPG